MSYEYLRLSTKELKTRLFQSTRRLCYHVLPAVNRLRWSYGSKTPLHSQVMIHDWSSSTQVLCRYQVSISVIYWVEF